MAIDFKFEYYLMFVAYICIIWFGLIIKKPLLKKNGLLRKIGYVLFLPLNLLFSLYIKMLKVLDKKRKDSEDDTLLNAIFKIF